MANADVQNPQSPSQAQATSTADRDLQREIEQARHSANAANRNSKRSLVEIQAVKQKQEQQAQDNQAIQRTLEAIKADQEAKERKAAADALASKKRTELGTLFLIIAIVFLVAGIIMRHRARTLRDPKEIRSVPAVLIDEPQHPILLELRARAKQGNLRSPFTLRTPVLKDTDIPVRDFSCEAVFDANKPIDSSFPEIEFIDFPGDPVSWDARRKRAFKLETMLAEREKEQVPAVVH